MSILIFILILVVLIVAHEFGHFIAAKAFGIRVDEFGIFFPPRLFAFKWGETEYSLNALPLGGFVKIFGENASSEPAQNFSSGSNEPGRSFASASRLQQACVVVAGIVFNLLFAWGILTAGYMYGLPTSAQHEGVGTVQNAEPTIVGVLPHSPADKAGLKAGDTVKSVITGNAVLKEDATAEDVQNFIAAHQNESLGFTVVRGKEEINVIAVPVDGLAEGKKVVGIELGDVGILQLGFTDALVQGAYLGKEITISTAQGLGGFVTQIFRGQANFSEVSGPIGITTMGGAAVRDGLVSTLLLTALISVNLAVLNLIPIPGLDGGRLLFIAIEAITKRPISERISVVLTFVGFGLLVLLMLVVSFHDVVRLVHPAV